jgi:glycine/D-amino acid oxidase-like deaminating enzyme
MRVLVVGAGIFGVTAAIELRRRGHDVTLVDPGPLPHPLAASTDVSKIVRVEYGPDADYAALGAQAIRGWRLWNAELGELYHETGVLFLRATPMAPGTFEGDSLAIVRAMGHPIERVDRDFVRRSFPAWNAERYLEGTYDPRGGWVESGAVVAKLVLRARSLGAVLREGVAFERLIEEGSRVRGIVATSGERLEADSVLLATGAWTPHILPELAPFFRSSGHPVFHLEPGDPSLFRAERFPVFGADISTTGWYGFPLHPGAGIVKIARHAAGRSLHPESPARSVTPAEIADLRAFLADTFPALAGARIVHTRVCLYCDSWDGHFWIARDPARDGLVVATGDSGHAFKFAPVLGAFSADAVEGKKHRYSSKFRWRPEVRPARSEEAARAHAADGEKA